MFSSLSYLEPVPIADGQEEGKGAEAWGYVEGLCFSTWSKRTTAKHQGLVWLDVGTARPVEPTAMQYRVSI